MHTSLATLLVLFGLLFFAYSAAAQSSPITSQLPQQTAQESPTSDKLLPLPPATEIVLLPNQNGSANDHAIKLQELKTWTGRLQNQKDGLGKDLQRFGDGLDAPNCAHIRIIQAQEMDSEMVVHMSPGDGGPIQTFQGLPPCSRDLPAPMTVQRFYSAPPMLPVPLHIPLVQPPVSQIPSAQPRPPQPKPDATDARP